MPGAPDRGEPPRDLDVVERWFQHVITHPSGVGGGIESDEARRLIPVGRAELEEVLRSSRRLSAEERVSVYANAYYARLMECLAETFPLLVRALGKETFGRFAFGYLQAYPSRSYTLGRLADHFVEHLETTRPDRNERRDGEPGWPDFIIDLARLERAFDEVFDGPGIERAETLSAGALRRIAPEEWPACRLVVAPCLRLLSFRYPVNDYFTAARRAKEDEDVPVPEPRDQLVAITRRDWIVRRYELDPPRHALLESLASGNTVGESIRRAAEMTDLDDEGLARAIEAWFRHWCAEEFFVGVEGSE